MWMSEILTWSKKRQVPVKKSAFFDTKLTYFSCKIKYLCQPCSLCKLFSLTLLGSRWQLTVRSSWALTGEVDEEGGALFWHALHLYEAMVILDNLVGNRQPEAGPLFLGGKKGIKNLIH